jgi:hypothetical protein
MAALATAANSCRWNRGAKAVEVLRRKLADAEAAAEAASEDGGIPGAVRLQAFARSRLDARALTTCIDGLLKQGLHDEARRMVTLCDRIEPEETSVASALLEALANGPPAAAAKVNAIAEDSGRPARIRLIALAWLISANQARTTHAPLLDIIGTAIDRKDLESARMGMEALQYLLWSSTQKRYGDAEWGRDALSSGLEWPTRADRGDDDPHDAPRWPEAAQLGNGI